MYIQGHCSKINQGIIVNYFQFCFLNYDNENQNANFKPKSEIEENNSKKIIQKMKIVKARSLIACYRFSLETMKISSSEKVMAVKVKTWQNKI